MNIQSLLQEVNDLPADLSRQDLIAEFKRIETLAFERLKKENLAPWSRGKGFGISTELTALKDTVILKALSSVGQLPAGIAVVAVGGYGRAELSPYSDIDLLILQKRDGLGLDVINKFLYLLWDMSYKLGHSVRTIRNVIDHAHTDITFLTAVFESRLLAGDENLHKEMKTALAKVLSGTRTEYARTKIEEIHGFFERMGETVLMKEPNLKENAGGLRSVHVAEWINYFFNFQSGFGGLRSTLSAAQFRRLYVAYDFILYVRNMLHFMCDRKEDTFYINYHPAVAGYLGVRGDELARLQLMMKRVYSKMMDIFYLSAHVVDENYNWQFKKDLRKIDESYYSQNKEFFVQPGTERGAAPAMKAILAYISGKYRPSFNFLTYLRESAKTITQDDRNSKDIFNDFITILSAPNSFSALNVMKLSDFLYRYLKPFALVRYFIIYNSFHTYTVDEHSLEAVRALELLVADKFDEYERSKVSDLTALVRKHGESLWIIKLTLLFHDIGKAIPGDHAKNGVEIAHQFFSESPLLYRYRDVVKFLIGNHLLLSNISRRSDIQDIDVVLNLAKKFQMSAYPSDYLDFLYLITYADVFATNPSNFTGYTATLLLQIYRKTKMALTGKIDRKQEEHAFEDKIALAKGLSGDEGIEAFLRYLGMSYVNQADGNELAADYALCKSTAGNGTNLAVKNFNEYLKVKVYAPDRIGVFASLTGILMMNGANVVKAHVFTIETPGGGRVAFDVFDVTDIFGADLTSTSMRSELEQWIARLQSSLPLYLSDEAKLDEKIADVKKKVNPTPAIFRKTAHVHAAPLENGLHLVDLSGSDRPALLYDIARCLAGNSISIQSAIVDTVGWHVQDKFEVTAPEGFGEADFERVKEELKGIIEG